MGKFLYMTLFLLFSACNTEGSTVSSSTESTTINVNKDTIIAYDIYDLSSQGGEASVSYVAGQLDTANVILYAESGRTEFHLDRGGDTIRMREAIYRYDGPFEEVKTNEDIRSAETNEFRVAISDIEAQKSSSSNDRGVTILRDLHKTIKFKLEE